MPPWLEPRGRSRGSGSGSAARSTFIGIPSRYALGYSPWDRPGVSWSQVLGDDAFLEHEVRPGLHLARLHDGVGAGHTLVEAEALQRLALFAAAAAAGAHVRNHLALQF